MILVMLRQSKHRRSFSHFSTGSPGAYLMDSCRDTSCNVRAARVAKDTLLEATARQASHRIPVL